MDDDFAEVEFAMPSELEIAQMQVSNLMMERDLLRASLAEIVRVVSDARHFRVWEADLQTCIYTHEPFSRARELLGLPSWLDELKSRATKEA